MADLIELKSFDIEKSTVSVWVFKTSQHTGELKFTGRWISITDDLSNELKTAVSANLSSISEVIEYSILTQNHEHSALSIMTDKTHAHLITAQIKNESPQKKVKTLKQISNSKFYVVKFVCKEQTLLAVRKTDNTWSTKKATGWIRMVFSDHTLDVDKKPSFILQPKFDFFVLSDTIFVTKKSNFESALFYKAGHEKVFEELKGDNEFINLFSDMKAINDFVGSNKIQLRRAIAIKQKGHYKNTDFIARLRAEHKNMNLDISFDNQGRIVPTADNCRHIFQALLDHRLDSRLSIQMYDVQSTEAIK